MNAGIVLVLLGGFMAPGIEANAQIRSRTQGSITSYGSYEPQQSQYQPKFQRPPDPEATQRYMSPKCASMNDSIRTAYSRGISGEKITEMRRDYSAICQDEESDARQKVSRDMSDQRQDKLEAKKNEAMEQQRAQIKIQQCQESKRILIAKKARTDLTDGEKIELQRFEGNYRTRCV